MQVWIRAAGGAHGRCLGRPLHIRRMGRLACGTSDGGAGGLRVAVSRRIRASGRVLLVPLHRTHWRGRACVRERIASGDAAH